MNLLFEAKYALRRLRKAPGHTSLSIVVIAFSIAISLVVFSITYHSILRPLDINDSGSWYLAQSFDPIAGQAIGTINVDRFTQQAIARHEFKSIERVLGYDNSTATLSDSEESLALSKIELSPELLQLFSIEPILGRQLQENDGETAGPPVVMLSYDAWQNYYNGDKDIIGKQSRIDSALHTIVGILPPDFTILGHGHFWLPLRQLALSEPIDGAGHAAPVVKLARGSSIEVATREINALLNDLKQEFPQFYTSGNRLRLVPLKSAQEANVYPVYFTMSFVAAVVTLLSCLNIGTLLFSRILEREKELAIRKAVGSSRWQIIRQPLLESLFVCLAGGLFAILLASLALRGLTFMMASMSALQGVVLPSRYYFAFGFSELLFVVAAILSVWLLSGLYPAIKAAKQNISVTLSGCSKGSSSTQKHRTTTLLVGFQIVFSCFLLIICGGLVTTINDILTTDYGIDKANKATARIALSNVIKDPIRSDSYIQNISTDLRNIAGVDDVGFTTRLPGSLAPLVPIAIEQGTTDQQEDRMAHPIVLVSDNYFSTMDIGILVGRSFDGTDNRNSTSVVIIDEHLANLLWPNTDPIGKSIRVGKTDDEEWLAVIGVSRHVKANIPISPDTKFLLYRPLTQTYAPRLWIVTSLTRSFADIRLDILKAASGIEQELPLVRYRTFSDYYKASIGGIDTYAAIFTGISIIALLLAATGIFAVITRTIIQQTQKIGIQRALGSSKERVMWVYLRKGIGYLVVGNVIGVGLALLLFGVAFNTQLLQPSSTFLIVFLSIIGTLTIIVLISTYLPTRKAANFEPGDALRYD